MRALIINPDGLGDLVLRRSLFHTLHSHGYEILSLAQRTHADLLPAISPETEWLTFTENPYSPVLTRAVLASPQAWSRIREYQPNLVVSAAFQRTPFDQGIFLSASADRYVAFEGPMYGLAKPTEEPTQQTVELVRVDASMHEADKCTALIRQILNAEVAPVERPVIPTAVHIEAAAEFERAWGLQPHSYYVSCVADDKLVYREWTDPNWAAVFDSVAARGQAVVITGKATERDRLARVRQMMKYQSLCFIASGDDVNLGSVAGLIFRSRGYLGKDTGPMHVAAAMGRPVVTVFGGGHWPRFTPRADHGLVMMTDVPCVGCGWRCAFAEPHCIRSVPASSVISAVEELETSAPTGTAIRLLPPGESLLRIMVRQRKDRVNAEADSVSETAAENVLRARDEHGSELHILRTECEQNALRLGENSVRLEASEAARRIAVETLATVQAEFASELHILRTECEQNALRLGENSVRLEASEAARRIAVETLATVQAEFGSELHILRTECEQNALRLGENSVRLEASEAARRIAVETLATVQAEFAACKSELTRLADYTAGIVSRAWDGENAAERIAAENRVLRSAVAELRSAVVQQHRQFRHSRGSAGMQTVIATEPAQASAVTVTTETFHRLADSAMRAQELQQLYEQLLQVQTHLNSRLRELEVQLETQSEYLYHIQSDRVYQWRRKSLAWESQMRTAIRDLLPGNLKEY